ncbi:hypothetical protein FB446DRAFT_801868 [Lentinula raphanica]|nr:hypothetical protein FB446DRAFT_801868 [Lentinula raphanica]
MDYDTSFFFSSDFISSDIILFGEVTFWTRLIFSAIVGLARFFIKKLKSVYLSLDKDIVRESWVRGDLKDQLGIGHRKGKSRKEISANTIEAAPMFHHSHNRSASEVSQNPYEPTMTSSPGTGGMGLRPTHLDTPDIADQTICLRYR